MNDAYKKLTSAILVAAVVALFAALATYLVAGAFGNLTKILLIVGGVLLIGYLVVSPESVIGAFRSRGARYGGNTLAMVVLFIGIIGAGNWFTNQHSQTFDLTANKSHSISQQTKDILNGLKAPVTVTGFFQSGQFDEQQAKDMLALYAAQSSKFTYRIIDPDKDPGTARQYGIVSYGTTVFESQGRRKDVPSVGEQEYTSALLSVTNAERHKVYFVTGNGQPDPNSSEQQGFHDALLALQNDNYVVATLDATATTVPEDASALILAGGTKPLLDSQKKAYAEYLSKGGKMLVMSGAFNDNNDLNTLIKPYGLTFQDGITIDPASSLAQNPQAPAVSNYAAPGNEIVKNVAVGLFPVSDGIEVAQKAPSGITTTVIAKSSDQSWLQNHKDTAQFRQGDTRGPITLMATAEGTLPASPSPAASASGAASAQPSASANALANPTLQGTPPPATATPQASASGTPAAQPTQTPTPIPNVSGADVNLKGGAKIVAVAGTSWINDQFLNFPQTGNRDLFLNSINHLVGNQALISITPKSTQPGQIFLLGGDSNLIFFTTVLFVPLAVIVVGAVVWFQRR